MKKIIQLTIALIPSLGMAQSEFNNQGEIYMQKGAMLHVQGEIINNHGSIKNDGIIEVDGNFENKPGSAFSTFNDNTSTERAVKFTGNGTQAIKGDFTNSQFYNLVIDKTNATDVVEMQTNVHIKGSLVFGSSTNSPTYNTNNTYSNHNNKGLIKTFEGVNEYVLSVHNGDVNAVVGYASMSINGAPTTAYIITKGTRGTSSGGFERKVNSTNAYDFPIGTEANGFNAVRLTFDRVPAGGAMVKGKFNDGTDAQSGYAGLMESQCIGCTANNPSPDDRGYSRYFSSNPCNPNRPQWVALGNAVRDHGYWSFTANNNSNMFNYMVEVFPNSYTLENYSTDMMRTVKYDSTFGYNPSADSWNRFVENVSSLNDLVMYSSNTGTCYNGAGIPGGKYIGIATHFAMRTAHRTLMQQVNLNYLAAEPREAAIELGWSSSSEINNKGFEVKRSTDGITFSTIGWVEGKNNSTTQQNYSYTDKTAELNTVYYYQLNQVDNDGASTALNTVSAEMTNGVAVSMSELFPNPAQNASSIVITSGVAQDISVRLIDMLGREVTNEVHPLHAGANSVSLNLSSVNSGTYQAVITADGKSVSKKLVVSNN